MKGVPHGVDFPTFVYQVRTEDIGFAGMGTDLAHSNEGVNYEDFAHELCDIHRRYTCEDACRSWVVPLHSNFAASRTRIHSLPRAEYARLLDYSLNNKRVFSEGIWIMEKSWAVILGCARVVASGLTAHLAHINMKAEVKCAAGTWGGDVSDEYECKGGARWDSLQEAGPAPSPALEAERAQVAMQRVANPWFRPSGNPARVRLGWNRHLAAYEPWQS
eukprot:CAMPEP_0118959512 /NCGR_PEP_ID=MMETSP1169-20130426/63170_1 /TAXON_ID=36882 /ORGANISM="Pyramimonas obovata, Strain CCMP722" /LENGTH=217 /DNA_ID=CAMNT_0006907649 /DNA_START=433 /DNA_END=1082 /DNA_ORIENTATION=+